MKLALFTTKNKKTDKSPDYSNKFIVSESFTFEAGEEYQLAGWNTKSKNGLGYISIKITKAEQKNEEEVDF